jgi:hypothetical protein
VHVTVDLAAVPPAFALEQPDDCTRFDVVVSGTGDDDALGRALVGASVGRTEGSEALVSVAAVRQMASGAVGASWEADFLAMLDYAQGQGWLTDDGEEIRAHVQWR